MTLFDIIQKNLLLFIILNAGDESLKTLHLNDLTANEKRVILNKAVSGDKDKKKTIHSLVEILQNKGLNIATKIYAKVPFYKAEDYHQDYYKRIGKKPYCHAYIKRF